ncbi:MAG: helix-turn-helix domain-containing protein [Acidobacteriota bacterium]|nr:helix-turn-helix domain-containing protein [Acidobacteriota bacterium]
MSSGGKRKPANRLWLARKRRALRQKQVASLLNHHTTDQISRYEKGLRLPQLETALRLEIIYGMPLRVLFKDLYEQLERDIRLRVLDSPALKKAFEQGEDTAGDYCAYDELARGASVSPADQARVRRHLTKLARKLAYL